MNYKVYQGTELKQTVTSKIAVMNGLQPNLTYEFGVEADNGANLLLGTDKQFSIIGTNISNQCDYAYTLINGYNVLSLVSKFGTQFTVSFDWSVSGSSPSGSFYPQWEGLPWNDIGLANPTVVSSSNTSGHASYNFSENPDSDNLATMFGFRLDNFVGTITFTNLKLVKGGSATTSVTTRGIRFNIPKTLTVDSTIMLRYEEYPLGIVPIGNEPSGYFGGGNKQNLSAKVISTANGSSVVEVAGNVIDVGNKNLWVTSKVVGGYFDEGAGTPYRINAPDAMIPDPIAIPSSAKSLVMTVYNQNKIVNTNNTARVCFFNGSTFIGPEMELRLTGDTVQNFRWDITAGADKVYLSAILAPNYATVHDPSIHIKYEFGDIATPYAAFVDGDTFTAQPDGTCALFSEHKALYY